MCNEHYFVSFDLTVHFSIFFSLHFVILDYASRLARIFIIIIIILYTYSDLALLFLTIFRLCAHARFQSINIYLENSLYDVFFGFVRRIRLRLYAYNRRLVSSIKQLNIYYSSGYEPLTMLKCLFLHSTKFSDFFYLFICCVICVTCWPIFSRTSTKYIFNLFVINIGMTDKIYASKKITSFSLS